MKNLLKIKSRDQKVIEYLNLNWNKACLSPHKNMRRVSTTSETKSTGSSEAWRKFLPFLKNSFDLKYL